MGGTRPSRALVLHFATPMATNRQTPLRKTGTLKTGALLLLLLLKPTTRTSSGTLVLTLAQLASSKMVSFLLSKSSGTLSRRFKPNPIVGAAMDLQVVPGGVCTDGKPTTSVKEGLSEATNVKEEEFLEGQAFYACMAPSQYVLPKVNSVAVTQTANAAKQKKCAQTLTKMLKMSQVTAGLATDDAKCITTALVEPTPANQAKTTNAACTGTGFSAVEYPLWLVGIGGGTSPA